MEDVSSVYSDVTTGIHDVMNSLDALSLKSRTTHGRHFATADHQDQDESTSDFASFSASDTESPNTTSRLEKMCLHIHCDGRREEYVRQLYQSLFDWIDPAGEAYNVINETDLPRGYGCNDDVPATYEFGEETTETKQSLNGLNGWPRPVVEIPCLAIVLFLREDAMVGSEKVDKATTLFDKEPWKFHHSESISRGKINAYPYNNQNYYTAGPNDPLCAVRQIHCGKQHVRLVRFTGIDTWQDQINFYSLILGQEAEIRKTDFCLFTAASYGEYDVQFALKKVPKNIRCKSSSGSALGFRVGQIGNLVPLLPHMCSPVSDTRWRTTDLEGNVLYLDIGKSSRDSDSGVSTSYPVHSTPYARNERPKFRHHRKYKHKRKCKKGSKTSRSDESDSTSSVITDLDAFMKSVLQPLIEHSRNNKKPPSVSSSTDSVKSEDKASEISEESSAKSSVKSVRFNQIVHYLSDCGYPSETDHEAEDSGVILNGIDAHGGDSSSSPPEANRHQTEVSNHCKNSSGHHAGYNDTDEESYFSEAGVDVDFPSKNNSCHDSTPHHPKETTSRPKEPPPYKPPPPHPNAKKATLGFYI